ncbi:sporulation protein YqfD [Paenisporosarcina sp. HGH0030]|uniref:sporulation protein YqfD n=1 Tax=Paenisporosarcina sp. HGH0030 TaxID=1078085 RepID=UPI00034E5FA7|nr:sporulation protein YqfD [Paenisporosarcina sp. HGH0030]EPD54389.1 sporulation protein YqfD [Paenisporosarcina sp. HGH0030]
MGSIESSRKITCQIKPHDQTYSFLQALKVNKVYIIKLSTNKSGTTFTIYEKDIPKVRKIRKQFRIPIHFSRPDNTQVIHFHWSVLAGLLGFILVPYICSLFLWQISIEDVSDERQVKLEQELHKLNVIERKSLKSLVPDSEIRQVILANNHDLSWIHIKRTGAKMHLTSVPAPVIIRDQVDKTGPSDLVALRKGVITHYDLRSGERLVPINATVKKGDRLVTGLLKQGNKNLVVGAEGQVFADYWLEMSFQLPTKIVYDKFVSEEVKILQVSPAWKSFKKEQNVERLIELFKSAFRVERNIIVEKSSVTVNEQWIKEAFMPMLRMRTASTLSPNGKIKDEKILHMTWSNDTVKGKVLYYMNDNIAGKSPIHQGD